MNSAHSTFQKSIDDLIKLEYHQICFKPNKQQALQRLTSINPVILDEVQENKVLGVLDNNFLNHYISHVYQKYGIQDPIIREMKMTGGMSPRLTPQKKVENINNANQGNRLTKTKKKLINLKDSFKRDNEQIVYSSEFSHSHSYHEPPSTINVSKTNKEIGYRTKEKIRFKAATNHQAIPYQSPPQLRQFSLVDNQTESNKNRTISIKEGIPQDYQKNESEQTFVYCPMCQAMVLEEKYTLHKTKCNQLQQAQSMHFDEFQLLIANKIKRIQEQINHQIIKKDKENWAERIYNINSIITLWMNQTGETSFQQVRQRFQNFSLNLFNKLSKLNWFRAYQNRIHSERKIVL